MTKEIELGEQSRSEIPTDINNVLYQKTPWETWGNKINPENQLSETVTPTSDNFNNVWEPKVAVRSEASSCEGFNVVEPASVRGDIIFGG